MIVTVSTGVLGAGQIAFAPAFAGGDRGRHRRSADGPSEQDRAAGRGTGPARHGGADPCLPPGRDPGRSLAELHRLAARHGSRHRLHWRRRRLGAGQRSRAALDFARGEWRAMLGGGADRIFAAGGFTTDWGPDPHHLGAYSYARPGGAGARAASRSRSAGGGCSSPAKPAARTAWREPSVARCWMADGPLISSSGRASLSAVNAEAGRSRLGSGCVRVYLGA